jgi:hypothetical protein
VTGEELRKRKLEEVRQAIARARELHRKYVMATLMEGHFSKIGPDHANRTWLNVSSLATAGDEDYDLCLENHYPQEGDSSLQPPLH